MRFAVPPLVLRLAGLRSAARSGRAEFMPRGYFSPGGAGEVSGDDVGGVPIETATGAVVSDGGPGIGVGGGFLHVAERHAGHSLGRRRSQSRNRLRCSQS